MAWPATGNASSRADKNGRVGYSVFILIAWNFWSRFMTSLALFFKSPFICEMLRPTSMIIHVILGSGQKTKHEGGNTGLGSR